MTEIRREQNVEFFNNLKSKGDLTTTKARRLHLIEKHKITKSRANDIAKRV